MAAADERAADAAHEQARAMALVRDWGGEKGDRVNIAKARQEQQPDVIRTRQANLDAYAYRKLIEARHEAFVRDAAVVSRELTRRVDKDIPERRVHRWGGGR